MKPKILDHNYKEPDEKRCASCGNIKYSENTGDWYCRLDIRRKNEHGGTSSVDIQPFGLCDYWDGE